MLKIIIAFTVGTVFGVTVMCCCMAAGRADRMVEKELNDDKADIS